MLLRRSRNSKSGSAHLESVGLSDAKPALAEDGYTLPAKPQPSAPHVYTTPVVNIDNPGYQTSAQQQQQQQQQQQRRPLPSTPGANSEDVYEYIDESTTRSSLAAVTNPGYDTEISLRPARAPNAAVSSHTNDASPYSEPYAGEPVNASATRDRRQQQLPPVRESQDTALTSGANIAADAEPPYVVITDSSDSGYLVPVQNS